MIAVGISATDVAFVTGRHVTDNNTSISHFALLFLRNLTEHEVWGSYSCVAEYSDVVECDDVSFGG
jgi:hypothetical protein